MEVSLSTHENKVHVLSVNLKISEAKNFLKN
jgi:hypothetical protein